MRRIIVAVCPMLALLACAPRKQAALDAAKLKQFATDYTAAWCSQDPARVAAHYAGSGSLTINGSKATGRAAIAADAQGFMTAFPDMVVVMDSLVLTGSHPIYHWTFIGTNTGPGGTGKAVHFSGYEEWTIGSDGLIAESNGHFDSAEYQRQLKEGVAGGAPK
jgi:hypothetical protein